MNEKKKTRYEMEFELKQKNLMDWISTENIELFLKSLVTGNENCITHDKTQRKHSLFS